MRSCKILFYTGILFLVTASSCLTGKKMDKRIGQHYGNTIPTKGKKSDFVNFKFENTIPDNDISHSAKTKNKIVPALFYWEWDIAKTATLNTMMPMSNFTTSFVTELNAKKLKEKINGATIDIIVKVNPGDFHLRDQGWLVYLVLAYVSKDKFFVDPVNEYFSIDYIINRVSGEKKSGQLTVKNLNREKAPRFFQTFKGMVSEYLTACDANMKIMAKELADKLVVEVLADQDTKFIVN
jgi:hypothetical protein